MKIQQSKLNINGIKALKLVTLGLFATGCSAFSVPYPGGGMVYYLLEPPVRATLSLYAFPIQKGVANTDFKFNIKPYFAPSRTDFSYYVTNAFFEHHTRSTLATESSVSGLPPGVIQIKNRAADCPIPYLLYPNESCILHFYVNRDQFVSAAGGYGPYLLSIITYRWGHHYKRGNAFNAASAVIPAHNVLNLLQPIVLPIKAVVKPLEQDGLKYDPNTQSIVGKPTRTGSYIFEIGATSGTARAAPRELKIEVSTNLKDKPVFKSGNDIISALPEQEYRLNLMDLIETHKGFMVNNQITFAIDTHYNYPDWLSVDENNLTQLTGLVPKNAAGTTQEVTVVAQSNTGGISSPLTIRIPVSTDPSQKPVIDKNILLTAAEGETVHHDFRYNIIDPAADGKLTLHIENIEPKATWLKVSSANPTEIDGRVPETDAGINYLITLTASTPTGGKSEEVVIPLNITPNKALQPRFYQDNPTLPLLYEGQPYLYDFVANKDVTPEFADFPYLIELAQDYINPDWVSIKDNKLIIDKVPQNSKPQQKLYVTINNVPGGLSEVITLTLFIIKKNYSNRMYK